MSLGSAALAYLRSQPFSFSEAITAANATAPRVAAWLKRGDFPAIAEMQTGTGHKRHFCLADVYGIAVMMLLTDDDRGLAISIPTASAIWRYARDAVARVPVRDSSLALWLTAWRGAASGWLYVDLVLSDGPAPQPGCTERVGVIADIMPTLLAVDRALLDARGVSEYWPADAS